MKFKVPMRKLEGASNGVRTAKPKKKGNNKVQAREKDNTAPSHVGVDEKSSEPRRRRKGDLRTKSASEGFAEAVNGNSGWKRKIIYADSGRDEARKVERIARISDRNFICKASKNVVGSHFDKSKKVMRAKTREVENPNRSISSTGNRKFKGSALLDKKIRMGKKEGAEKQVNARQNGLGSGTLKTRYKKEGLLVTKTAPYLRNYTVGSVEKPGKKKNQDRKSLATDSELMEGPVKKKKRVIRIDPHDLSNKRLDDDIGNHGEIQEKKDFAENSGVGMSQNAQFRAIRPSTSILSFVEDNLLGRRREIEFRRAGYNTELSAPLDNIPFSTGSERERIELPVFRNKLEFFAAAKISSSFPSPDLPEIAFAGRSNVGKSSLLNALTRQWGVARTSDKPGLTQSINFFNLGSKLCLVDLPGYGFAYAKEEVKEAWEELVKEYVTDRVGLKRVCLLVDTKWGMKPRDHELIDLMERSQTKYQIVLTKTDVVFPIDVARRAMQIEENLKAKKSAVQPLMMVSSKTGAGIRSLRTVLAHVARFVRG